MTYQNWTCSVCLIDNDGQMSNGDERIKCEACETAKVLNRSPEAEVSATLENNLENNLGSRRDSYLPLVHPYEEFCRWRKCDAVFWGSGECDQIPLRADEEEDGVVLHPRSVSWGSSFVQVACGALHTAAVTSDGAVVTFGCNDDGALGRNVLCNSESKAGVVQCLPRVSMSDVACGNSHSMVRSRQGDIFVFGSFKAPSGAKYTLGPDTRPAHVPIDHQAIAIRAGADFDVALCFDSSRQTRCAVAWGINTFGQFGVKESETWTAPHEIALPHGQLLLDIFAGGGSIILKCVSNESVFNYFSAGKNSAGESGQGSIKDFVPEFRPISAFIGIDIEDFQFGDFHVLAMDKNGGVWGWGLSEAALPDSTKREAIKTPRLIPDLECDRIVCGGRTSAVILKTGVVVGWGDSSTGQLMTEEDEMVHKYRQLFKSGIVEMSVASQHGVALKSYSVSGTSKRVLLRRSKNKKGFKKNPKLDLPPRRSQRIASILI